MNTAFSSVSRAVTEMKELTWKLTTQKECERAHWVVASYLMFDLYCYVYCDLDDAVPGSPPQNVRARPVSSNTVVVQWDEPKLSNGVIRVCLPVLFCLTLSNLKRQIFILYTDTLCTGESPLGGLGRQ